MVTKCSFCCLVGWLVGWLVNLLASLFVGCLLGWLVLPGFTFGLGSEKDLHMFHEKSHGSLHRSALFLLADLFCSRFCLLLLLLVMLMLMMMVVVVVCFFVSLFVCVA